MAGRKTAFVLGDPGRLARSRGTGRYQEDRRLQPRRQRRQWFFRGEPEARRALECDQGLSAAGHQAAEPDSGHRRACDTAPAGRQACDGDRILPRWRGVLCVGAPGDRARGRRDRLAADPAMLRDRSRGPAARARRPAGSRESGRWRKPAGPPAVARGVQGEGREDAQRMGELALRQVADGSGIPAVPHRAADHGAQSIGRVHQIRPGARARQHRISHPTAVPGQVWRPSASVSGLYFLGVQPAAGFARVCTHPERRPGCGAADQSALSVRRR